LNLPPRVEVSFRVSSISKYLEIDESTRQLFQRVVFSEVSQCHAKLINPDLKSDVASVAALAASHQSIDDIGCWASRV
jgi:hypothetical protein